VSIEGKAAAPVFDHLQRLTDGHGLFEHALHDDPRRDHGYCLDDIARALLVTCREPRPDSRLKRLARQYLDLTLSAVQPDGTCHNRMSADGDWNDTPALGDWWGRALWGLGVAAVQAPTQAMRASALLGFRTAAQRRSPHRRAMAFAALGAGELLLHRPDELSARELLRDAVVAIGTGTGTGEASQDWPWPEPRLTYANGSIAEALLVAGAALPDSAAHSRGLQLLTFLLDTETRNGHLSLTAVNGRGPGESAPRFDQQPIEAAALADACARAYGLTHDPQWLRGLSMAWAWFGGDNDNGTAMYDPATGGGFDGLQRHGCNLNRGAESTLALLSTAQQAKRLGVLM
jgi:hypothetical protein